MGQICEFNPGSLASEAKLKITMPYCLYKCSVSKMEEMIGCLNFSILEIPCYFKLYLYQWCFILSLQSLFSSHSVYLISKLFLSYWVHNIFFYDNMQILLENLSVLCVLLSSRLSSFVFYMIFLGYLCFHSSHSISFHLNMDNFFFI